MITVKPVTASAPEPGYTRVAAVVRYNWWRRERLWFDVPQSHAKAVNHSSDCWLMALLPLAFERGETLRICAPVDPVLLQNAEKIQRIWSEWFPPRKPVQIDVEGTLQSPPANGGKTGLFFSGGVDSFFSLLHFDQAAGGGRRIDDLIYVWGFDLPLKNRAAFERKMETLSKIAARLGKNLIPVVTNPRQTRLRKLPWGMRLHGPALGAAGLLLGARFKTILLSASFGSRFAGPCPWGEHVLTTPWMSFKGTRFIRYGGESNRFEKTTFIAQYEIALQHLHVCWAEGANTNCGHCEKCCRTLLALELLGVRNRMAGFPDGGLLLDNVKRLRCEGRVARGFLMELKEPAVRLSRRDVLAALEACLDADADAAPNQ
jgi:hypothetical protein